MTFADDGAVKRAERDVAEVGVFQRLEAGEVLAYFVEMGRGELAAPLGNGGDQFQPAVL